MESATDPCTARQALEWLIELGADEAIGDAPVDRYALADKQKPQSPKEPAAAQPVVAPNADIDPVAVAREVAAVPQISKD